MIAHPNKGAERDTRLAAPDEKTLNEIRQEIEQSSRLVTLGTVATAIAHEYNNLLTPVISYDQLASKNIDNRELLEKSLQKIAENAQRAADISESLLGFARNDESGDRCEVQSAVDSVFSCLARDPAKDRIRVQLDIEKDLMVAMPMVSLQQVLMNLFINALEVMHESGGLLAVSASQRDEAISLRIEDSGPGIDEEILPYIFEAFVTQKDKKTRKGNGLGLAIVQEIVERHGGQIRASNREQGGASFYIELPLYVHK